MAKKNRSVATAIAVVGGVFGLHRFYMGRFWTGVLMLFSLGGLGVWWIIDIILLVLGKLSAEGGEILPWINRKHKSSEPKYPAQSSSQNGEKMTGNALVVDFTATIACKFPGLESVDDGSFYIEALEFRDVAICTDVERSGLKDSKKKLLTASMWEEHLAYSYELDSDGENWIVTIEGGMAAEILEDKTLEEFDLNEMPLENVIISWAEDGDSPKVVGQETELEEIDISNIEIRNDFEEYP